MKDNLYLGLRWFSHELANGLSVLRSSLDLDDSEMTEQSTQQLIGLLRAVQVAIAEGEGAAAGAEHWQDSLRAVARLRGIEVVFHCEEASFKQYQVLTSLFLALIPRVLSGTMTLIGNSTKTSLSASVVLDKVQEDIKSSLQMTEPQEAKDIPFYFALAQAGGRIEFLRTGEGEGIALVVSAPNF